MNKIISYFLLLFIISSCQKSVDSVINGKPIKLPSVIQGRYDNDNILIRYHYDNLNRIIAWNSVYGDSTAMRYSASGLIAEEDFYDQGGSQRFGRVIYSYSGNHVAGEGRYFQSNGTEYVKETFNYTINDKQFVTYSDVDGVHLKWPYSYSSDNNLKQIETMDNYCPGGKCRYMEYAYNDKPGIFSDINIPQWFLVSSVFPIPQFVNNCTQVKNYSNFAANQVLNFTNTYDSDGFPVRIKDDKNTTDFIVQYIPAK